MNKEEGEEKWKSKIELKESENLYSLKSWLDINGKPCYPGAIVEYDCDLTRSLFSDKMPKLYGKITQSEYGWWGILSPEQEPGDRPDPIWTLMENSGGFKILDEDEGREKWETRIRGGLKQFKAKV